MMKNQTTKFFAASVAGALLASLSAHADLFTGDGDGTSWEDPDNWLGDAVPLNNTGNVVILKNFHVSYDAGTWAYLDTNGLLQSPSEHRVARLLMGESTAGADNGTHSLTMDQGRAGTSE